MNKQKQAFTLVELIVVITILAILGTIAFISLQGYSTSARDSTRVSDLSSMKTGLELFHLDAGKYPKATDGVNITYSGAVVWNQGTFGETVFANVDRLDKIPTDPLTEKEYTYSTLLTGNEYELGGMVEGELISYRLSQIVNAADTTALAYTTGNYNGQMTKSLSGNTCNVLSLPTIITNDTSVTDLEQIVTEQKLVYNGYKNLPSSFKTSKFKYDGGFDFTTTKLVAYSDTGSCAPLTSTTSNTARLTLLQGLQQAYSGTIVQNEGEIKNIVSLNIDLNDPSPELINYTNNYVNNTLGGKLVVTGGSTNNAITNSNCTTTTQSGYTIPQLDHGINNQLVTKTISNGTQDIEVSCNDGTLTYGTETTNCENNFIVSGESCILDTCTGTMPANAELNGTQGTSAWTYNTTPGVCKYTNQTGYHTEDGGTTFVSDTRSCVIANGTGEETWNGSNWGTCSVVSCNSNYTQSGNTCEADTQNVTCGGSIPNFATASTSTTYTQTWNGSNWTPTTSWGENQATCDFDCNGGYSWNGSSCIQNNSCNTTEPTNSTLTAGSPTSVNQAWQSSNPSNACYFSCNSGYSSNGTVCIQNCTTGLTETTLPNGQIWSCMNLGASTVRDGTTNTFTTCTSSTVCSNKPSWYGDYYQWGRNDTGYTVGQSISPYNYGWEPQNDTKWGGSSGDTPTIDGVGTTTTGRKGPCPTGRHVPSVKDWKTACNTITGTNCQSNETSVNAMKSVLRIPMSGYRWGSGNYGGQGTVAFYWSSSPYNNIAYNLGYMTYSISPSYAYERASLFSVRCLKN